MTRLVVALALLAACGGEPAPTTAWDPRGVEAQLPAVKQALDAGDGEAALAELDAHAQKAALPDGALHLRALALEAAGRRDAAAEVWQQQLDEHPGDARALAATGLRALEQGRVDEAAERIGLAASLSPGDVAVRLAAGRLALRRHEDESALRAFQDVLQRDPWSYAAVEAHLGLAQVLERRGGAEAKLVDRHAAAATHLQDLLNVLGTCRQALRRNPADVEALHGVASVWLNLYTEHGDVRLRDRAAEALQAMLALAPDDARALYGLGFVRAEQGRLDEGLQLARRAVEASPQLTVARVNLVLMLLKQGRTDEAEGQLEHLAANALDPKDRVRAHADLARMLARDPAPERRAAGLAHARAALELDAADPYRLLELIGTLEAGSDTAAPAGDSP